MTSVLKISALTKRFGDTIALDGVTLDIAPAQRVALLGHNGAGKSTLLKLVLGLISPNDGDITVLGSTPGSPASRRQVAYLPENVSFHPALTGMEQLRHYLALRGEDTAQAPDLLDRVGLLEAANRRIGTYSKGMRQRVGLAQALIGHPQLLVLDEPTSGLDPISRRQFYELLDGLAAEGAAILLSSHALTEVEARTDRILILSQGRLVSDGSLAELRQRANLPISVHVTPRNGYAHDIAAVVPGAIQVGNVLHFSVPQSEKLQMLAAVTGLRDKVAELEVLPPSLEDIYSHFSGKAGQ